jgi:cobalt-zinc-cadmium efflux system outer membrane protein
MTSRHVLPLLVCLFLTSGCSLFTAREVDKEVREMAFRVGVGPVRSESLLPDRPPIFAEAKVATRPPTAAASTQQPELQLVTLEEPEQPKPPPKRLVIPADLPGADAPPLKMPEDKAERRRVVSRLYPPIPSLPKLPPPAPGPEGHPLSLSDLQRLAETYSPTVKNAFAAVQAARGAAYQAGQYPNPTLAFEHDTVETGPAGYPGFYVDQVIKTGGKLTVAQAAATMDVLNAELAFRRARSDLRYAVRGNYLAVLVALENIRVNEALYRFTHEVYRIQVELVGGAEAAAYEPMQLRPLVLQAQLNLTQAQNQYKAAWRQLAASLGLADMPPTELEGRVDQPVPVFDYQAVLARLATHTDVLTAQVSIEKAKYNLKAQKLVPLPDVELRVLVQKDFTTPPNQIANSTTVQAVIPLWDKNRGGIRQAEWLLAQASVGPDQARNALITTLADAFDRYRTASRTVAITGSQVRDQVRVFRGVYERRQQVPGQVGFGDVVSAEQTLSGYVSAYVTALGLQWQAVVDVANLLQAEDLFQGANQLHEVVPLPDLKNLLPPPAPNVPDDHVTAAPRRARGPAGCPPSSHGLDSGVAPAEEPSCWSPALPPGPAEPPSSPPVSGYWPVEAAGTAKRGRP